VAERDDELPEEPPRWEDESSGRYEIVSRRGVNEGPQDIARIGAQRARKNEQVLNNMLIAQLQDDLERRFAALDTSLREHQLIQRADSDFIRQSMVELFTQLGRMARENAALAEACERNERLLRTLLERQTTPFDRVRSPAPAMFSEPRPTAPPITVPPIRIDVSSDLVIDMRDDEGS
jgi:hypothetical protein